jgi:hypothetical protein
MEIIRAIQLTNKGALVARLKVRNTSGAVVTTQDILAGKTATIDLNQYLNKFNDGDTITVGVVVVVGRNKKSSREFIYRAGALDIARFEISGTTLSNKLTFVETKNAYEYHIFYEEENNHEINGINYKLIPEESIAIVVPKSGEYKGVVRIPSTVTYQKKKYVVTEIGKFAFLYNEELTSLTIPASICFIDDFIIKDDYSLKTIRVESDTPAYVENHGFREFPGIDSCTLSVPLGSVEIYKNSFGWELFKNIKSYWNRPLIDRIEKVIGKIRAKDIIRKKIERPQK